MEYRGATHYTATDPATSDPAFQILGGAKGATAVVTITKQELEAKRAAETSETPRTDAKSIRMDDWFGPEKDYFEMVATDFSRTLERELTAALAEIERLRGTVIFAGKVLKSHREHVCDVDGFDVQEWALKYGLLEEFEVKEVCGERCECDIGDKCYRLTDSGSAAIDAAMSDKTGGA